MQKEHLLYRDDKHGNISMKEDAVGNAWVEQAGEYIPLFIRNYNQFNRVLFKIGFEIVQKGLLFKKFIAE